LQKEEAVLVSRIYSASGLLKDGDGLIRQRPFRSPHHTISRTGMVGGGAIPTPGEISLAHQGVLFLDEMTEFSCETLDLLRQPLEEQHVRLVRLHHKMVYPADFMLVGAANPCRCGEYLEPTATCRCTAESVRQHLDRLSGPLLDRIDLVVEMTRLGADELRQSAVAAPGTMARTADMARAIRQCWQKQQERCQKAGLPFCSNGRVDSQDLAELLFIPEPITAFAADSSARLGLSVRAFQKMLRVSRTIADLDLCPTVSMKHMAEAFQYRLRRPE
jgi:magnesium chelatase family protein